MKCLIKNLFIVSFLSFSTYLLADSYSSIQSYPSIGSTVTTKLPFDMDLYNGSKPIIQVNYSDEAIEEASIKPQYKFQEEILFAFNSSRLLKSEMIKITNIVHTIIGNDYIVVIGRADTIGKANYNLKLSEKRALNISKYLIKLGVLKNNIETRHLGDLSPTVDCTDIRQLSKRKICENANRSAIIGVYDKKDIDTYKSKLGLND